MYRLGKAAGAKAPRGFESPSLRQNLEPEETDKAGLRKHLEGKFFVTESPLSP
jgi:hypothetical protein